MDGRLFFNKRLMSVATWDGKTKYKSTETAEEEAERLKNWDQFLEGEEAKEAEQKEVTEETSGAKEPEEPMEQSEDTEEK